MGLKKIKASGENAARLIEASKAMSSINNTYGPPYNAQLAAIGAVYPGKKMTDLTDAEIDSFYDLMGDATAIAEAKAIMAAWEPSVTGLAARVLTLPINDI